MENINKDKILEAVYKLQWKSGHYYIGVSKNVYARYKEHIRDINKNKCISSIKKAIEANPKDKLPTLEIIYTPTGNEDLTYVEGLIIEENRKNPLCLNKNGSKTTKTRFNKYKIHRKITLTDLNNYEYRHIVKKYGSVEDCLKYVLKLDGIIS